MKKMFTTLIDIVKYRAQHQGNRKAYTFLKNGNKDEVCYTYKQLDIRARAIAAWLQSKVQQGDRVMLLYHQGLDFISAFYACLYAGVIAVPGYPPEKQHRRTKRLQAVVQDAGAKIALTTTEVLQQVNVENSKDLLGLDMEWFPTDTLSDEWAKHWQEVTIDRDTVTYLQYSSGSTGNPKGIMVSHGNMLDNSAIICERLQHTEDDVSVSWLPIFHDLGLIGCVVQPMYAGFHAVSLSPYEFVVNPLLWLKAIDRFRGTTTCCPNFGFDLCVRKITPVERASLNLRSWRVSVNCAEPVRYQTLKKFTEAFSPCGFREEAHYPMYGMAETTLFITGAKWDKKPNYRSVSLSDLNQGKVCVTDSKDSRMMVSCGQVGTGLTIKIVDPKTLTLCERNEIGEIWIKGSSVAHGYWNRPAQTREDFAASINGDGPYLRTGDLGYFIDDELFIAGRYKDLIIIRGRNLYPQDIELTVESCSSFIRPGCGAAFSIDHQEEEKLIIVQELRKNTAEFIDVPQLARHVQQKLAEEHGVVYYELIFIEENSAQKTSSGKIQRRACKQAYLQDHLKVVYRFVDDGDLFSEENQNTFNWKKWSLFTPTLQRAELQRDLIQLLRLRVEGTAWEQKTISFLGLDSIKVLQSKFILEQYWGVELPKVPTLLTWTWDQLLNCIHAQLLEKPAEPEKSSIPMDSQRKLPLNRGQEALWYIQQSFPQNTAYLIPIAIRFPKEWNKHIFYQSIQCLVNRHPVLGSSIQQSKDGKPFLQFEADTFLEWTEKEAMVDFSSQLTEDAYRPFPMHQAPLFRTSLYKHADGSYTCLLCFHHLICDLWSLDVFLSELRTCYLALEKKIEPNLSPIVPLTIEPVSPKESNISYWKEKLAGDLPVLDLPKKQPRGVTQSFQGQTVESKIRAELVRSLGTFAREQGATLYQVFLAVYQLVLSRYSGQRDVVVGTPAAGRSTFASAKQFNYMVNPVVIRGDLSHSQTFIQLLKQTIQNVQEALENEIPFIDLVEQLAISRDPSIPSVFQAMLAYEQTPLIPETAALSLGLGEVKLKCGQWEWTSVALANPTSQFDLTLKIAEYEGEFLLHWQYDASLFEKEFIKHVAKSFSLLLEQIVSDPNQSIDSYACIAEETEEQLIQAGRGKRALAPVKTLNQAWLEQVKRTPDAIAVVDGFDRITYQQMKEDVNQFAHMLQANGVGIQDVVGIALNRQYPLLVAVMAVLQIGAAYVGLDPSYPENRLAYMVRDTKAVLVVSESNLETKLRKMDIRTLLVESGDWRDFPKHEIEVCQNIHDLAYFIYTSGSTGKPKGVAIEHYQTMTFVQWAQSVFSADELAGMLFGTSICFDLSIFEIFVPLLTGGKVIMAENALALSSIPAANEVTLLNTVPSAAKALVAIGIPTSVTTVNLAGEPLTRKLADELYRVQNIDKVYNLYGPSECTTYSTYALVPREENKPPTIGKPIQNTDIYILDSQLRIVPLGTVGELCIGGSGVARGYINQPEKTKEKFIDHPKFGRLYRTGDLVKFSPSQELVYVGRSDFQVKIRGYRIELGEIEAALQDYPSVKEAVVVANEQQLIAYVTKDQDDKELETVLIKKHLENILPSFMMPSHLIVLSSFPLTLNGKIDRKSLPEPAVKEEDRVLQPTTEAEAKLLAIWQKVLKKREIAIHDRFFEIGGDSILSLQVIAEAKRAGLQISPKHFFTHPTIAKMASVAAVKKELHIDQGTVTGKVGLTPVQRWFFHQLIPNYNNWNQSMILTLDKKVTPYILKQVLEKLVDHHDALRLRFRKEGADWVSENAAEEKNVFFKVVDGKEQSIDELHRQAEEQLNITEGPLLNATYVQYDGQNAKLILVVHHLAMDGVSWRILLDDIQQLYRQLESGVPMELVSKTTSYANWSKYLQQLSKDDVFIQQEKQIWLKMIQPSAEPFPVDYPEGVNTDTQVKEYIQVFTTEETKKLLYHATKVKINEWLLAALWQAYQKWSGKNTLRLDVEGHGRDHQREDLDVSRTIGWFTSIYPLFLQGDAAKKGVHTVQKPLRNISHGGIGFGILRYLRKDEEIIRADTPALCFNYLGQFDQMIDNKNGIWKQLSFFGPRRYQEVNRPYYIEINSYIQDGRLIVSWAYSKALYRASTITSFAAAFSDACMSIQQKTEKIIPTNISKVKDSDLSRVFSKIKERKGR